MINALIIIGIFATIAMILAGGKIIMQLSATEKMERKTLKRNSKNYFL